MVFQVRFFEPVLVYTSLLVGNFVNHEQGEGVCTIFSLVIPTFQVGYYAGKPIESAGYWFDENVFQFFKVFTREIAIGFWPIRALVFTFRSISSIWIPLCCRPVLDSFAFLRNQLKIEWHTFWSPWISKIEHFFSLVEKICCYIRITPFGWKLCLFSSSACRMIFNIWRCSLNTWRVTSVS